LCSVAWLPSNLYRLLLRWLRIMGTLRDSSGGASSSKHRATTQLLGCSSYDTDLCHC
jgi:hypothetical protein